MEGATIWQWVIQYGALAILSLQVWAFTKGYILPGYMREDWQKERESIQAAREAERKSWEREADGWKALYLASKQVAGSVVDLAERA